MGCVMELRKAKIEDVRSIHELVNYFADQGQMLHRSLAEIYENLRDFMVAIHDGQILACCSLHIIWEDLVEIRALAVHQDYQGEGVGADLVQACLCEAREMGFKTVSTLTLKPEFFEKLGFKRIDLAALPRKMWGECFRCPKFPNCDEVPLVYELTNS
ncbi:MAG: N-acetyltransferase [Chloroflexi bacterium]|nr:N-acetyltransferase [Chloroflexota bacterium]MCL5076014.1 N-acetyltransferase [Chloroflexota bacterium]